MKITRAAAMLFCWLLAAPLSAQITQVTVAVDGMACPFCGYGIEKRLLKVDAVAKVTIDLEAGEAEVKAEGGRSIDLAAVRQAIEKAGFTPGELQILARGRVVANPSEDGGGLRFELGDGSLPLIDAEDELATHLAEASRDHLFRSLRATVRWSEAGPELTVEQLERVAQ